MNLNISEAFWILTAAIGMTTSLFSYLFWRMVKREVIDSGENGINLTIVRTNIVVCLAALIGLLCSLLVGIIAGLNPPNNRAIDATVSTYVVPIALVTMNICFTVTVTYKWWKERAIRG